MHVGASWRIRFTVRCCQLELDKTAEDFRRAHVERQELLSRWQQTIDTMHRRDTAMDLLAAVRTHDCVTKGRLGSGQGCNERKVSGRGVCSGCGVTRRRR